MTISNILIAISAAFTFVAMYLFRDLYIFGMNDNFLDRGNYYYYFIQFFTSNFLHGGLLHLLFNSVFIYYFGNVVEVIIGKTKYLWFFIFTVFFNGIAITFFSNGNTIGISGFAMALLTYYTLELKSKNHPDYKGGITAIIINIGIGLMPGISLVGHLFGAIAGVIYYLINKNWLNRVLTPVKEVEEL